MPGVAPLAISMGDPAGIGPEVIAKAWARRDTEALPCFFAVGDVRHGALKRVASAVGEGSVVIAQVYEYLSESAASHASASRS